jgi:lipid-A-disaccharide synthase
MDKEVVKELIQDEMNLENVKRELSRILKDQNAINKMKSDYADLKRLLSEGGNASEKAAQAVIQVVKKKVT